MFKRIRVVFLFLCIMSLALCLTGASALEEGNLVPSDLQGVWNILEATGEDSSFDLTLLQNLGGVAQMVLTSTERYFTVDPIGIGSEAIIEKLTLTKEGLLFSDTGRVIDWNINDDNTVLAMSDSSGTCILAARPDADLEDAEIPAYPSIPQKNDVIVEIVRIGDVFFSVTAEGVATYSGFGEINRYAESEIILFNSYVDSPDFAIKKVVIEEGITDIGYGVCAGYRDLISVSFPDSMIHIGDRAFSDCNSLKSIIIPDGVTSIGEYAFSNCISLTSIMIPDSVLSIGDYAFMDCNNLTSVTIPNSAASVGEHSFEGCNSLTSIVIGEDVEYSSVDGMLINEQKKILISCSDEVRGKLTIPDGIIHIGERAFRNCSGLTNIIIPDSVTSIGDYAFQNCDNLAGISIPDSVTTIGNHAFQDCSSLVEINIPASITSIGEDAFSYCRSLERISVESENAQYSSTNGWLFDKNRSILITCPGGKKGDIRVPDSVISIGDHAFRNCGKLTSITISASVTSIGDNAFIGCSNLRSIEVVSENTEYVSYDGVLFNKQQTVLISCPESKKGEFKIPDSVTIIGDCAFYRCEKLTSIIIPESVNSIGSSNFSECENLISIFAVKDSYVWNWCIDNGLSELLNEIPQDTAVVKTIKYGDITMTVTSDGVATVSGYGKIDTSKVEIIKYVSDDYLSQVAISKIVIEEGITSIGYDMFDGYDDLISVIIPDSVIVIESYAFTGCEKLISINIPDGVTSIGNDAFSGCHSLTSINIPDGVTKIGDNVFAYCSSLYEVIVPDSVTQIGESAFAQCESLTSISIPDSLISIGEYAFSGCSNLTSITIPDSVINIGKNAFMYCSSLTNISVSSENAVYSSFDGALFNKEQTVLITCPANKEGVYVIPDSVTRIEDYAFMNCINLSSIIIPESVIHIGDDAFCNCSSLTSITIPESVTNIGDFVINGCENLTSIYAIRNSYAEKWCVVQGYYDLYVELERSSGINVSVSGEGVLKLSGNGKIEKDDLESIGSKSDISEIIIEDGATGIGDSAFSGYRNLTAIFIPNSVTSIGNHAFSGCESLIDIAIPDSVTSIGSNAFQSCKSLSSVILSNNLTSIEKMTFDYCESLSSIIIPDSINSIGEEAFYHCTHLSSVTIPNSVTEIGDSAFRFCESLITVTIPDGLTSIEKNVFSDCKSLVSVIIPDSVTSIGYGAFGACGLTDISFPDSIISIGESAFMGCNSLASIRIPYSVTGIGDNAFSACNSLTSINVESENPAYSSFEGVLFNKGQTIMICFPEAKEGEFAIPYGLSSIDKNAFSGRRKLTSIIIPDSVTSIGEYAFSFCTCLTDITIPSSVISIGERAFYGCDNIIKIKVEKGSYAWGWCNDNGFGDKLVEN